MTAVQAGPTNITVSWSPSSDATSYRIDYDSSGGYSGAVGVIGGYTDGFTLTGLANGDTYTITIYIATSDANFIVTIVVGLGKSLILCKDKTKYNLLAFQTSTYMCVSYQSKFALLKHQLAIL